MKTFTKSLSGLLSASALAIGLSVIAQPAAAGIATSAHDLSTQGASTEICVYCHTPHGANTVVNAPLWNKTLPGSTYTIYTSATLDGTIAANGAGLTVSLACLSCHDGTQARDNMINFPGSGGYNPPLADGTADPVTLALGLYDNGGTMGNMPCDVTGAGGTPNPCTDILNLGTDLSNDHPIGMNYCAATTPAAALAGTCQDDSFFFAVKGSVATRLWVDTDGGPTYQKTDLPLYGGSAGARGAQVECATCHDPHNTDNGTFLRVANDASSLCLTCHDK